VLLDTRCQELWSLLQAAQGSEYVTRQDIVRYRREAERHVGQDDNLYKLQWVSPIVAGDIRLRYDRYASPRACGSLYWDWKIPAQRSHSW